MKVGWDSLNRLATENKDMLAFVVLLWEFYQTKALKPHEWDISPSTGKGLVF
jgi:hypothetical protein